MPLMFMGFKLALFAAGAIGAGIAVAQHWEDIKTIVENFDEIADDLLQSIRQKQRRKVAMAMGGPMAGSSGEGDLTIDDYDIRGYTRDTDDESDATTRGVLRRRTVPNSNLSSSASTLQMPSSSQDMSEYYVSSEPESVPEFVDANDLGDHSDFSVIASEAEWTDAGCLSEESLD